MNENKRQSFIFYQDWCDLISKLDDATALEVCKAIMSIAFDDVPKELSPTCNALMLLIRPRLEKDKEKYEEIVEKRRAAGRKHRGNQYTNKSEQMEHNGTNGTSVPTMEHMEQVGTNGTDNVLYKDNKSVILMNNTKKEEKDISISTKKRQMFKYTEDFEQAFKATGRKGSKANAFRRWQKLSDEDKEKAKKHIPFYYQSNDKQYLKDFEGYLNGRYFENVVYNRKGEIIYDPERETAMATSYTPMTGIELRWSEQFNCYLYTGQSWNPNPTICDGYKDEDRPDGATIMLNNARGTVKWNKQLKKWDKV